MVVSANVKNFTRPSADAAGVLLHTSVTVGYDTSWRQVEALLLDAARRTDGLRADASPFVLKTALGNVTVEYQLNAALAQPEQRVVTVGFELATRLWHEGWTSGTARRSTPEPIVAGFRQHPSPTRLSVL